jgi:hypothetical protein
MEGGGGWGLWRGERRERETDNSLFGEIGVLQWKGGLHGLTGLTKAGLVGPLLRSLRSNVKIGFSRFSRFSRNFRCHLWLLNRGSQQQTLQGG